jgi:hypothetical protein
VKYGIRGPEGPRYLLVSALILVMGAHTAAQSKPQTYKGLELTVADVTRATNVSLSDCPQGANTQRGVIKPGDPMEFAAVKVDFKVLPALKPGPIPKPTLTDESGKVYNTAQSFGDVAAASSFSCTFAFRIPKGAKVTKFSLDTASIDLTNLAK